MEPTPAAPVKKSSAPTIIAVIVAAILSLCCCGSSIPIFLGLGTYDITASGAQASGALPPTYGLICIGAGIIPWVIPLIVAITRRPKKK